MQIKRFVWETIRLLREELRDLKRCQVQYFALSVTATTAVLGLAASQTTVELGGLAMLAPLALLLPSWMIFFDKATTITRLVGFQRLLEEYLARPEDPSRRLRAWESALHAFREAQDAGRLDVGVPAPKAGEGPEGTSGGRWKLPRVLFLRTRHRYWMLNWYTFCALSFLCCTLGYNFLSDDLFTFRMPLGIRISAPERSLWASPAFVLTAIVAVYTFRTVISLVQGRNSYEANTEAWRRLQKEWVHDGDGPGPSAA